MGKKHKKETKKRKHRSRSRSTDKETDKDKRKHHKRHHKLKKKEKCKKDTISVSSQSDGEYFHYLCEVFFPLIQKSFLILIKNLFFTFINHTSIIIFLKIKNGQDEY